MEVVHVRCAGLDIHKKKIAACVRCNERGQIKSKVMSFGTMTEGAHLSLLKYGLPEKTVLEGKDQK
jgi:hypothetical protein